MIFNNMLYHLVEESLRKTGGDRFRLVQEVVELAKSAPMDIDEKPVIWALKMLAKDRGQPNIDAQSESSLPD
jgi:hypothetical protein